MGLKVCMCVIAAEVEGGRALKDMIDEGQRCRRRSELKREGRMEFLSTIPAAAPTYRRSEREKGRMRERPSAVPSRGLSDKRSYCMHGSLPSAFAFLATFCHRTWMRERLPNLECEWTAVELWERAMARKA